MWSGENSISSDSEEDSEQGDNNVPTDSPSQDASDNDNEIDSENTPTEEESPTALDMLTMDINAGILSFDDTLVNLTYIDNTNSHIVYDSENWLIT